MKIIIDKKEHGIDNSTHTQAGFLCIVGMENSRFKAQFFIGSLVIKVSAYV